MEKRKVVDGLVSIIMPSWNTERFIAETIQSVIDQTYQNWELLIVDDCSTDNTDEVVASFKDDRIKYFHNEKKTDAVLSTLAELGYVPVDTMRYMIVYRPESGERSLPCY